LYVAVQQGAPSVNSKIIVMLKKFLSYVFVKNAAKKKMPLNLIKYLPTRNFHYYVSLREFITNFSEKLPILNNHEKVY